MCFGLQSLDPCPSLPPFPFNSYRFYSQNWQKSTQPINPIGWLLQSRVVLHTFKLGRLHKIPSGVNFTIVLSYLQFLGSSLQVFHVELREAEDICA
jgi:hypothetical protein